MWKQWPGTLSIFLAGQFIHSSSINGCEPNSDFPSLGLGCVQKSKVLSVSEWRSDVVDKFMSFFILKMYGLSPVRICDYSGTIAKKRKGTQPLWLQLVQCDNMTIEQNNIVCKVVLIHLIKSSSKPKRERTKNKVNALFHKARFFFCLELTLTTNPSITSPRVFPIHACSQLPYLDASRPIKITQEIKVTLE